MADDVPGRRDPLPGALRGRFREIAIDARRSAASLVHWAGTETATYWPGYMHGAVSDGERVAAEVLR